MSILSEKYKVPEPVIKNMIRDGVISCSWSVYDEVVKMHAAGKSIDDIAFDTKMSTRNVRYILKKVK